MRHHRMHDAAKTMVDRQSASIKSFLEPLDLLEPNMKRQKHITVTWRFASATLAREPPPEAKNHAKRNKPIAG